MVTSTHHLRLSRSFVCLCAVMALAAAQAQSAPPPAARPDPLNPQARVPTLVYTSPMSSYRRLGEDTRVPWVEANDKVTRIGGWRTYTREAQQPESAASAAPPPTRGPKTAPPAPIPAPARRSPHQH